MSEAVNRLLSEFRPQDPPKARYLQDVLMSPWSRLIVALRGRVPDIIEPWDLVDTSSYVGMLTVTFDKTLTQARAHLDHVVVEPHIRRQGVGRRLVETAITLCREQEVNRIDLMSSSEREAANPFYKELGFEWRKTNNWRLTLT